MLRCKACAIPVPNSKERRSLESSSSEHVKLALEACFREDGRCAVATRLHVSTGYVCKKCFLLVDKKVRIKNELEKVKVNLKDKVSLLAAGIADHLRNMQFKIYELELI